jgi:lysylphosphatidylglycerol synthetase-like protein (DUF2156 family)
MQTHPRTISITLIIILMNAVFWLGYAAWMAFGSMPAFAAFPVLRWIMAGLALASAAALAVTAFFLRRRIRLAYWFGLILLAVLAVLSITDEFGLLDLVSLLLSLVPLALMLKDRRGYLRSKA